MALAPLLACSATLGEYLPALCPRGLICKVKGWLPSSLPGLIYYYPLLLLLLWYQSSHFSRRQFLQWKQ